MAALIRTRESTLRWSVRVDVVMQEVNGGTQAVAFAGAMGGPCGRLPSTNSIVGWVSAA